MLARTTVEASKMRAIYNYFNYFKTFDKFNERSYLYVGSLVVMDSWHHWTHKFKEYYERLMSFDLFPLSLRFIYKSLHHFWVFAWMDGQHSTSQEGTVLFGDSLVLVLRVNILENLFGSEGLSIVVISFDPKSRSVIVLIIRNVNIVFSEIFFFLFITLISTNFHESILILVLTLNNMLLS